MTTFILTDCRRTARGTLQTLLVARWRCNGIWAAPTICFWMPRSRQSNGKRLCRDLRKRGIVLYTRTETRNRVMKTDGKRTRRVALKSRRDDRASNAASFCFSAARGNDLEQVGKPGP